MTPSPGDESTPHPPSNHHGKKKKRKRKLSNNGGVLGGVGSSIGSSSIGNSIIGNSSIGNSSIGGSNSSMQEGTTSQRSLDRNSIRTISNDASDANTKNSGNNDYCIQRKQSLVEGINSIPRKNKKLAASNASNAASASNASSGGVNPPSKHNKCSDDNDATNSSPSVVRTNKKKAVEASNYQKQQQQQQQQKQQQQKQQHEEDNTSNAKSIDTKSDDATTRTTTTNSKRGRTTMTHDNTNNNAPAPPAITGSTSSMQPCKIKPPPTKPTASTITTKTTTKMGQQTLHNPKPPWNARQQKIAASIRHRRQLLAWVRNSRLESQKVQSSYGRGERRCFIMDIVVDNHANHATNSTVNNNNGNHNNAATSNTNNNIASNKNGNNNDDDNNEMDEIARFRKATQLANKSAISIKNASRELRRNSSAGKRGAGGGGGAPHGNAASSHAHAAGGSSSLSSSASEKGGGGPLHPPAAGALGATTMHHPPNAKTNKMASSVAASAAHDAAHPSPHAAHPISKKASSHTKHGFLPPGKQLPLHHHHRKLPLKSSGATSSGTMHPPSSAGSIVASSSSRREPQPAEKGKKGRKRSSGARKGEDGPMTGGPHASRRSDGAAGIGMGGSGAGGVGGAGRTTTTTKGAGGTDGRAQPKASRTGRATTMGPSVAAVRLLERRDAIAAKLNALHAANASNDSNGGCAANDDGDAPRSTERNARNARGSDVVAPPKMPRGDVEMATKGTTMVSARSTASSPPDPPSELASTTPSACRVAPPEQPARKLRRDPLLPTPPPTTTTTTHPQLLQPDAPSPPQRLPPRRKTQWDAVLEEMRWIAADFVGERKWKVAVAKTLSGAAAASSSSSSSSSSRSSSIGSTASKKRRVFGGGTPVKKIKNGTPGSSSSSARRSGRGSSGSGGGGTPRSLDSSASASSGRSARLSADGTEEAEDVPMYVGGTKEDGERIRQISKLMSVTVMDHWDSVRLGTLGIGVGGGSGGGGGRGTTASRRERYKRLREGVVEEDEPPREETNNASKMKCDHPPSKDATKPTTTPRQPLEGDTAILESNRSPTTTGATPSTTATTPTTPPITATPHCTRNDKMAELRHDEISLRMDAALAHIATLRKQTAKGSALDKELAQQEYRKSMLCGRRHRSDGNGGGEGGGGGGGGLSSGQLNAVRFLERLWGQTNDGGCELDDLSSEGSESSLEDEGDVDVDVKSMDVRMDVGKGGGGGREEEEVGNAVLVPAIVGASSEGASTTTFGVPAIVGGSCGVGKTVAVCALLWKNRKDDGPQLIVCSTGALIRWKYELEKFDGLNGRIYGSSDRDNDDVDNSDRGNTASDVVVCDYASFSELAADDARRHRHERGKRDDDVKTNNNFASLVLDLRHPSSSFHENNTPKKAASASSSPVENVKWWISLNNYVARCSSSMKRLVIERTDLPQNRFFSPPHDNEEGATGDRDHAAVDKGGVSSSKRVDEMMLAMKLAFVYHPSLFYSERASIGKRVVSWAKREAKIKKSMAEKRGDVDVDVEQRPSSPGYGSVLAASLRSMCESIADLAHVEDPLRPPTNGESCGRRSRADKYSPTNHRYHLANAWEVRMCSLGRPQQAAYDRCCLDVRGSDEKVAGGLLKLRKACIHSNVEEFIGSLPAPSRPYQSKGQTFRGRNGSILASNSATYKEPSIDAAKRVMRKSSKMRELLQVLIRDCGYDVARELKLTEMPADDDHDEKSAEGSPKKRVKVIVLATLVEAQLLTSFFLSAVGLHHEVLVSDANQRHAAPSYHGRKLTTSESVTNASCSAGSGSAPWAWSQNILSQFDSHGGDEESNHGVQRSVDILIASPKAISSQNGGIGATSATAVISIDEDWSGREAFHVASILTKIHRRELGTAGPTTAVRACKFIKIICQNTCEDTFLCRGNITKLDGRKIGGETKLGTPSRRGKVGTRRSSRKSARAASKTNKDEMEADDDKDGPNSPADIQKPMFLRLVEVKPEGSFINKDGFLVAPMDVGGKAQIHKSLNASNDHHLIGSNIVRYRNSKMSSVLCVTHDMGFNSDQLFLPTKSGRNQKASVADYNVTFAWALFNTEEDASYVSTARRLQTTSWLPGVNCELQSITVGPTATPISVGTASIRCCFESLWRSHSSISQGRSKKQMRLLDHGGSNLSKDSIIPSTPDALSSANPVSSSKVNCRKEANPADDNTALLVYRLPSPVSRKRTISDAESTIGGKQGRCLATLSPHGEVARSMFSFCFSSFNSSTSAFVRDGNQGCEPLVYFPSFLPSLLQIIQQMMHTMPQESMPSGIKRKDIEGKFNGNESKRLRMCTPLGKAPSSFPPSQFSALPEISSQKPNVWSSVNLYNYDPFSFSVETNPHPFREDQNESGNAELIFTKRLLAADLGGAISCQSRPSLKSMILITHKKHLRKSSATVPGGNDAQISSDLMHKIATHAGKKSLHKKAKKHSNPSPTRDRWGSSYFRNEHLFARSYSATEGMKSEFASSLIGRVRLQFRLNDLVSNSFSLSLSPHRPQIEKAVQQSQHPVPFRIPRTIGPVLLGTIPCVNEKAIHQKPRSHGITLPVGVKAPELAQELLEESSEAWTITEDSILGESLSRYGMNWQLAASAVSSSTVSASALVASSLTKLGNAPRRSPAQCQNRWKSLETKNVQLASSSPLMEQSEVPRSSTTVSSMASIYGKIPRFANEVEGGEKESIIYGSSSSIDWLKQEPSQSSTSRPDSVLSKSLQTPIDKKQPLFMRTRKLKEVSEKRRVATTPIPGSAPTHASHSESIHAARASMLSASNGIAPPRHEMWPLELLDYVKKNKVVASQHSQRDIPRGSAPHSVHPPSQSPHRQQSSVTYHPPHNVHPPQHHVYHGAGQIPNQHPPYRGHMHHAGVNPNIAYQAPRPRIPRHHNRSTEQKKGST